MRRKVKHLSTDKCKCCKIKNKKEEHVIASSIKQSSVNGHQSSESYSHLALTHTLTHFHTHTHSQTCHSHKFKSFFLNILSSRLTKRYVREKHQTNKIIEWNSNLTFHR